MTKMLIPRMTTSDDHHPGNGKNTDKKNCAQESVSTVQGFLRCEDRPTCSVCYFSTVIFITLPDNFNKWHKIFVSLHLALAFTTLNFHFCSSLHNIALTGDSVLSRTWSTAFHAHVCHVWELEFCKELFFLFAGGLR